MERCLQQIEALRAELGNATAAIVANAIGNFEQSIARQQELLGDLSVSLPAARALAAKSRGKENDAGFSRLYRACGDFRKASAPYAALLVLSSRSARRMQLLYRTAGQADAGGSGESWSLSA